MSFNYDSSLITITLSLPGSSRYVEKFCIVSSKGMGFNRPVHSTAILIPKWVGGKSPGENYETVKKQTKVRSIDTL